jgi:hypothetical protein
MFFLIMIVTPLFGLVAMFGIPLRVIQLLNGSLVCRYKLLKPWGKVIVGLGAIAGIGVLVVAAGAAFAVYSYSTCSYGAGCAQGEFSVAFSFGLLGLAYIGFELLLLPLMLSFARTTYV